MSEIKLLPCPFCGGEVKMLFIDYDDLIPKVFDESIEADCLYFHCYGCDSEFYKSDPSPTPEKMIEWFNTRQPMKRIVERLENEAEKAMRISEKAAELGNDYEKHMLYQGGKGNAFEEAIEIVKEEGGLMRCE